MNRHLIYLSLAMAALSLDGAIAQMATGVNLEENDLGRASREKHPVPAVIQIPGGQLPPPGGNPLWGIPMTVLNATRERPVFSASRRPPAPPPAPMPVAEAPPPPPPPPEPPHLTLIGTAMGDIDHVAVVIDQPTRNLVRLHVGEAVSGWSLRSLDSRSATIEKDSQTVTLALPSVTNSAPQDPEDLPQAAQVSRAF
jgi:general secretion pathway protein N